MAVQTAATVLRESLGSVTLIVYNLTSVADADTFDTGLGNNIVSWTIQTNGNAVTQASAGNAATLSSGVFTLYPGENSLGMIIWVLARA